MVLSSYPRRIKLAACLTFCLVVGLLYTNYHVESQYFRPWDSDVVNQLFFEPNETHNFSKTKVSKADSVVHAPAVHNKRNESLEESNVGALNQVPIETKISLDNASASDAIAQLPTEHNKTATITDTETPDSPPAENNTSPDYSEARNESSGDVVAQPSLESNETHELSEISGSLEYILIPPVPDESIHTNIQNAVDVPKNISASPLENCTVTNQVRLEINSTGHWFLHSLSNGHPKEFGGDDFYVTFTDYGDPNLKLKETDPTAVAMISYVGNGTYSLDFVQPPMRSSVMQFDPDEDNSFQPTGKGILTVYFAYTCSIGSWDFASKHKWLHGGASQAVHSLHNVTAPQVMRPFQFPPFWNADNGGINFADYDNVVCFGDSVLRNFCGATGKECPPKFHKKNLVYFPNVSKKVSNGTISHFLKRLATHFQDIPRTQNGTNALIMSSSAWDLLLPFEERKFPDIDDHITALRELLVTIRQNYTNFSILWKSPEALHIHVPTEKCFQNLKCVKRVRYMSNYYLRNVYDRQKALMQELDIPFLDLYELTYLSAGRHSPGDGIHYTFDFNHAMLNLTYPRDYPETPIPECEALAKEEANHTVVDVSNATSTNDTNIVSPIVVDVNNTTGTNDTVVVSPTEEVDINNATGTNDTNIVSPTVEGVNNATSTNDTDVVSPAENVTMT
eukprot:Nitzschia sp. Nitz4//scaffold343_size17995//15945//17981//NITZ4_008801-RA/size17995-processed-gene-0.24-mRNA-1//1//CDS//3329548596//6524//frame0